MPTQTSWLTAIASAGVALSFLIGCICLWSICCKAKSKKESNNDLQMITQTNTSMSNLLTETFTQTATATSHELSIPGFLYKTSGKDFSKGKFIAEGGGGRVYTCSSRDRDIVSCAQGRPLAIKIVAETETELGELKTNAFYQELSMMWVFRDNPHFVKVFAYSASPVCLVMQYCAYGDLRGYIDGNKGPARNFPYSKWRVIYLFREYCQAIGYMHAMGFAHCDVKSTNVLLDLNPKTQQLMVVVSDFGVSRVITKDKLRVATFQVSTLRGASIAYAAPDVLFKFRRKMKESNPRVWKAGDVYALSVTLVEMMKRRRPWKA